METFRRVIRGILKPDSRIYRRAATFTDFLSTLKTDGYKTWSILQELAAGSRDKLPLPVSFRNLTHPILIRYGTQDAHTIINNVVREEYGHLNPVNSPKWMIDAGAYIGDTTAYFLSRFPDLKIVALEPNPSSYEMAKLNLEPYGERAILLKKGLYTTDGTAFFSGDSTGASIGESGFKIDCTTISFLLKKYSIPHLDILKMDIEGAEEAIFNSNPEEWLGRVSMLIIEIHGDHIKPKITRILADNGFTLKQYRSIWYCQSDKR